MKCVLFLGLYMNSWIVCLCIVFFFLNGGIVLYECDYRTDTFLIFASFDQRPFQRLVASRVKWSLFVGQYRVFPISFTLFSSSSLLFFLIPLSLTPPVVEVCQLLTNHPFVQREQWHLKHVSISSCYRERTQICGKVCLISANMNKNWSSSAESMRLSLWVYNQ